MTSNNYITILGWMTNLDIKGNELLVYAVIHGFSQDKDSYFHGSISYLCNWTKTSEVCMIEVLKKLVDKGLLEKITRDGTTNLYRTINPFEENVSSNVNDNSVNAKSAQKQDKKSDNSYDNEILEIVNYLNKRINSNYRVSNPTNKKLITSKLKLGFTVNDFKIVIDNKVHDWINNPEMSKYLRPTTLFGNKFENYLNQRCTSNRPNNSYCINNKSINTNNFNNTINQKTEINTDTIY